MRLTVAPHRATGDDAHLHVLEAALSELLTAWPPGSTLVIDYANSGYAQALAYPPSILTEIGRLDESQMQSAVRFGWMDPTTFSARHADFESQPVWEENPVREWEYPLDSLRSIALFVSGSAQSIMGCDPADGYGSRSSTFMPARLTQRHLHNQQGWYHAVRVIPPLRVEVPGIEPGSSGALSGLLRAQLTVPLLGPANHVSELA